MPGDTQVPLSTLEPTVGIIYEAWLAHEMKPGSRDIIVNRTQCVRPRDRPRRGAMSATALVTEEAGDMASSTGFLQGRRRASAKFPRLSLATFLPWTSNPVWARPDARS